MKKTIGDIITEIGDEFDLFIIEMLKIKRGHLLTALQYVEAGCDNQKTINVIESEIKAMEKRIKDLEDLL